MELELAHLVQLVLLFSPAEHALAILLQKL